MPWILGRVRRRRAGWGWGAVVLGVMPAALHPAAWLGARSGGCGRTGTAATVALGVIALVWTARPMKCNGPQVG